MMRFFFTKTWCFIYSFCINSFTNMPGNNT
jgi:hypothetical protein